MSAPALDWVLRKIEGEIGSEVLDRLMPARAPEAARSFHAELPGYAATPLVALSGLAGRLGLGGIWVKDEAPRLGLHSFKALGGSYAIYRCLEEVLGQEGVPFSELEVPAFASNVASLTLATATDGNHGRGVAWTARHLGLKAVIYVHEQTSQARIDAIAALGAEVRVVHGTYDDAVRQADSDARHHGWQVISDTSWEGYEEVPTRITQGYSTLFLEAHEQLESAGAPQPTHLLLQGGVGALASAGVGAGERLFGARSLRYVVVEPERAACLLESARAGDGRPHALGGDLDTIMAGLACGEPSPLAWSLLWPRIEAYVATPDYVAAEAMRIYARGIDGDPSITAGESGAVTLGALVFIMLSEQCAELRQALELGSDSQVLLVNTEGATDPAAYQQIVHGTAHSLPRLPWRLRRKLRKALRG